MKLLRKIFKRNHYTKIVNAESKSGEWDIFFPIVNGEKPHVKIVRFDEDNHHLEEFTMSYESWEDLTHLIRRIT